MNTPRHSRPMPRVFASARPPAVKLDRPAFEYEPRISPQALSRYDSGVRAADAQTGYVIQIFGSIGEDWWGDGTTTKTVSAQLDAAGAGDIEVHINSPGGDMFEGISIFNLLQSHRGKVTVKVLGLAASAASVIAMAGDEVRIGLGAFLMIHNCWVVAIGNRHDMAQVADYLAPFDAALRDIYKARTDAKPADIEKWMDEETFFSASQAIELGFADATMRKDEVVQEGGDNAATRAAKKDMMILDTALQGSGMSRSQRRSMMKNLFAGKPSAAHDRAPEDLPGQSNAKPGAGRHVGLDTELRKLRDALRS